MKYLTYAAVLSMFLTGTAWGYWTIETVDTQGSAGRNSAAALDQWGNPGIAYRTCGGTNLKYAYRSGGVWQVETVDDDGNTGVYPSIAFDSSGNPHISYLDYARRDLKIASWNGSSWVMETVDSDGDTGWYSSLALDSGDNEHICYFDQGSGDLMYAFNDGSSWEIQVVDSTGETGLYPSLELDPQGVPHVSYCGVSGISNGLFYALRSDSSWDIQTVDQDASMEFFFSSMELDDSGDPHIAYAVGSDLLKTLHYAEWNGSIWEGTVIDSTMNAGNFASLGLDQWGTPHISFTSNGPALNYSTRNGSEWVTEMIETSSFGETSLTVAPDGSPGISFWGQGERLMFAFLSSTGIEGGSEQGRIIATSFPNPSNGGDVNLSFEIPVSGAVEFSFFDISGRCVEVLGSEDYDAGMNLVSVPELAPGVYQCMIRAADYTGYSSFVVTD